VPPGGEPDARGRPSAASQLRPDGELGLVPEEGLEEFFPLLSRSPGDEQAEVVLGDAVQPDPAEDLAGGGEDRPPLAVHPPGEPDPGGDGQAGPDEAESDRDVQQPEATQDQGEQADAGNGGDQVTPR